MFAMLILPQLVGDDELLHSRIGQSSELRRFRTLLSEWPALLREGLISVRLLCVMLFFRYLKFFLDLGVRMVWGPEPIRAPDHHRWDGCVGLFVRLLSSSPLQRPRDFVPGGDLFPCVLPLSSCQLRCRGGKLP